MKMTYGTQEHTPYGWPFCKSDTWINNLRVVQTNSCNLSIPTWRHSIEELRQEHGCYQEIPCCWVNSPTSNCHQLDTCWRLRRHLEKYQPELSGGAEASRAEHHGLRSAEAMQSSMRHPEPGPDRKSGTTQAWVLEANQWQWSPLPASPNGDGFVLFSSLIPSFLII